MNKIAIIVGVVGAVVLIVSAVLGFRVLPDYINGRIEDEVQLFPLSSTWDSWSDIDRPLYMNVYVLDLLNPQQVEEQGAYPYFKERGPYAYRQRRRKLNLTQDDGERLVSYEQETFYFFDQSASGNNTEDDLISIINIPYVSLLTAVNKSSPSGPGIAALIANGPLRSELLIRRDVKISELLFHGMDVSLYKALEPLLGALPSEFDDGLFGLYKDSNGSTDGLYKIHTGVKDAEHFGNILTRNGKPDLGFWNPLSECDKVKGTDGSIFPPFVEKDRVVNIFSSDICRSLYLSYEREQEVKGVKGYRFVVSKDVLEDPRVNLENRCYCNEAEVGDCLGAGVIDISACRNGAPFVLSTPYFLDGDEKYSYDSGLWPTRERHETALVIEPNSGVLLKADKRIQVNMNYKKLNSVFAMANSKDMIFPIMWIEESVEFTDENVADLEDKLLNPKKAVETWRWVGVGVGIALILGGMGIYVWKG